MKQKIVDALKTEFKELGLGEKTIGRLADYIVSKGTVTKEDEISAAVKGEDVKLIAKSIQGEIDGIQKAKKKAEEDLADYKAKHPEKNPEDKTDPDDPKGLTKEEISKLIADGIAAGIKPVQDAFNAYKSQNSAKEAVANAKNSFYANKWTGKFKEEADDAWERAHELNEAKGGSMTEQELSAKATEYFNKAVQRKGTDTTKPFEEGDDTNKTYDFSSQAKHLQDKGVLPKEENK